MSTITCLIVEDEPLAAEILSDYVAQVPFLELKATCRHATEALAMLRDQPVDAMFLDLHLPGLKGFDFLRTLPHPPQVIVTTAYHQYALEGYELSVVDYLVKPIEFSRFLMAVNKLRPATDAAPAPATSSASQEEPAPATILIKHNRKDVPVRLKEITYLESKRDYVIFHLSDGRSIESKTTLQNVEAQLPERDFLRVHRSFIIPTGRITAFNQSGILLGDIHIPVGRNYKEAVAARLKG